MLTLQKWRIQVDVGWNGLPHTSAFWQISALLPSFHIQLVLWFHSYISFSSFPLLFFSPPFRISSQFPALFLSVHGQGRRTISSWFASSVPFWLPPFATVEHFVVCPSAYPWNTQHPSDESKLLISLLIVQVSAAPTSAPLNTCHSLSAPSTSTSSVSFHIYWIPLWCIVLLFVSYFLKYSSPSSLFWYFSLFLLLLIWVIFISRLLPKFTYKFV